MLNLAQDTGWAQRSIAVLFLILGSYRAVAQATHEPSDFRERIWRGSIEPRLRSEARELMLASWNIERGLRFGEVAEAFAGLTPNILLLQEVDLHARRSGFIDVAGELARKLGMNYAFAAEFQELGQGTSTSPAYHGQAVLASSAIGRVSVVRFQDQSHFWRPRWYLPNWSIFQRRLGERLALAAEIETAAGRLVVYNVHLESRGPEDLRVRQIREVLAHANQYADTTPVVIAGDLNVSGPTSPAIRAILEAGYRKALGGEVTTARGAPLDWIFIRGNLQFAEGNIHREVNASDHYPITVRLSVEE